MDHYSDALVSAACKGEYNEQPIPSACEGDSSKLSQSTIQATGVNSVNQATPRKIKEQESVHLAQATINSTYITASPYNWNNSKFQQPHYHRALHIDSTSLPHFALSNEHHRKAIPAFFNALQIPSTDHSWRISYLHSEFDTRKRFLLS